MSQIRAAFSTVASSASPASLRFLILGAGMQGRVIAENLAARSHTKEVVLADLKQPAGTVRLPDKCRFQSLDALDKNAVKSIGEKADVAVLCLPGGIALKALENLILARVPTVDVSFTPESPLVLDEKARAAGIPVVVDCGVAPGLCHMLAAKAHHELGGLDSLSILVGGIPLNPPPGFHHAIYFNARDLLDEYIRPARMRRSSIDVAPNPLQETRYLFDDAEVGPLEGFISDGLRTLLPSFPDVPNMSEITLRVPGHLDTMDTLHSLHMLDGDRMTDVLAAHFVDKFPGDSYPDRLLMEIWAEKAGHQRKYRLHDIRPSNAPGTATAMARSTGFTTAAAAVLLARKKFTTPGTHPPEVLGRDSTCMNDLIADLAERGVTVHEKSLLRMRS